MPSKNNISSLKSNTEEVILKPPTNKKSVKRGVLRSFKIEESKLLAWDILVAKMKNAPEKKNGTILINEAIELLFEKYKDV